ncbi:hypothetical protein FOQG_14628 [Fusarium oxysporum f. sp. raphani 54005]|uniref:Uncharacterized protein n=2 Tax=Fusarium oxysporum TaxID=5507 RepID=X0BGB5_FUSOX|nr:hypothetical protein FOMG_17110 [Fusarium oxysporum f. sp. melonis 26406]EXK80856.1 hypothetical protein FOQG_14628 [Fusarium oxysporum f. sp. raphani 54005]
MRVMVEASVVETHLFLVDRHNQVSHVNMPTEGEVSTLNVAVWERDGLIICYWALSPEHAFR